MAETPSLAERLSEELSTGAADFERPQTAPSIPVPGADIESLLRTVTALKQAVDVLLGNVGSVLDKAVTARELVNEGALAFSQEYGFSTTPPTFDSTGVPLGEPYVDPRPVFATPPTPTNLSAAGAFKTIVLDWDLVEYRNHAYTEIWRNTTDNLGSAVQIGQSTANIFTDASGTVGEAYYYWVRAVSIEGATGAFNASPGTLAGLLRIGTTDLSDLAVEASKLADGSVSATKLASQAITATKFANGIEPITINAGAPVAFIGSTVLNSQDGKLYRWNGSAYTVAVPTTDLSGQVTSAQVESLVASKISGTITADQLSATIGGGNLMYNSSFESRVAGTYRPLGYDHYNNASANAEWVNQAGRTVGYAFAVRALATTYNTFGLHAYPIETPWGTGVKGEWQPFKTYMVSFYAKRVNGAQWNAGMWLHWNTDPTTQTPLVNPVLTTSWQRYVFRITWGGSVEGAGRLYISVHYYSSGTFYGDEIHIDDLQIEEGDYLTAYSPSPSELLPDVIGTTHISNDAITTSKIIAGAIVAGKIATDAVTSDKIQAGAIVAGKLSAGAVTAEKITVAAAPSDNAIANASFEEGTEADSTLPARWTRNLVWGNTNWVRTSSGGSQRSGAWGLASTPGPGYDADIYAESVPVSPGEVWYMSCWAYTSGTNAGNSAGFYMRVRGGPTYGDVSSYELYPGPENAIVPATWTKYEGRVTIPEGMKFARPFVLHYRTNAGATLIVDDVVFRRAATAELIVDGAIIGRTIAANAITAAKIEAGAITTDKMSANSINGDRITAGTLDASKITADSITAGQIAAGAIGAAEIAAGAITTGKLLVTGMGNNLVPDGRTQDISAWGGNGVSVVSDSSSPTGYALHCVSNSTVYLAPPVAIDPTRNYRLRMSVKQQSGSSVTYLTVIFYDAAGNVLQGNDYSTGWPSYGTYHYFGLMAQTMPGSWTEYTISFGPGETAKIPAPAVAISVAILANYAGSGEQRFTKVWLTEKAGADLIVDGSIIAGKLSANAIVAGDAVIANGAITNALIANLAVDAAKIADATITTAKIGDAQITTVKIGDAQITSAKIGTAQIGNAHINDLSADKINAGYLSADRIATGAITAGKISVTDLAAISASLGNVSISSGGALYSGKTGYSSDTNGFWMGIDGGQAKFYFGNASEHIKWTGSGLVVKLNKVLVSCNDPGYGGLHAKSATAIRSLGTVTATASNGTPPYTYAWSVNYDVEVYDTESSSNAGGGTPDSNTCWLWARGNSWCVISVWATCTVTDATGLSASDTGAAYAYFHAVPP